MQDLTTQQDQLHIQDATPNGQPHISDTPTIQGATGAQYTPVDLKQFHKPIEEINKPNIHQLAQQLTQSFNTLINAILELQAQDKQPVSSSVGGDFVGAVNTILENAEWFNEKVRNEIPDIIENTDLSYEIESAVESHFSNSFSLDDHIDVASEIESIVDDRLDDMVQEKVEEYLREKLSTATISFN